MKINITEYLGGPSLAQGDGPAGCAPGGGAPAALPCQYNDNCIEKGKYRPPSRASLTPNQKTTRHKMILAVDWMVKKHGLERVGLLTLSFGVPGSGKGSYETWALRQQAKHWEFAQNRWHSFCTNVIAERYEDWVCVFEMHRDRVWHMHVIVATREDIRTGTDVATLTNYKLPYWQRRGKHLRNEALAAEWKALREIACRYRFGRIELLPVKKSADAVGRYLGDYLVKTYGLMPRGQKCRLVRFSKNINKAISPKFTIHGLGQLIYRTRLKISAHRLGFVDYGDFAEYFGPKWNFLLKNVIAAIPVPFHFPNGSFENGFALKVLKDYAENPKLYLDEVGAERLADAIQELWDRLKDALMENSEALQRLKRLVPGDNTGDRPALPDDKQNDLFQSPEEPF